MRITNKNPGSAPGLLFLGVQCKPPKSQINRMIGSGIPISQSKSPRPISRS
jgi:hypothetical protein